MPVNMRESCHKCGSDVEEITGPKRTQYRCQNEDCNWYCYAEGRWTSPHRQEDFPEGSIGWIEERGA